MTYEKFKEMCESEMDLDILEHPLLENEIMRKKNGKGVYYNDGITDKGIIFIENSLTNLDKKCTLAEEVGHHLTSSGNILNMKYPNSAKQERLARECGAMLLVDACEFVDAVTTCETTQEMAEQLNVTPETISILLRMFYRECLTQNRDSKHYSVKRMFKNLSKSVSY